MKTAKKPIQIGDIVQDERKHRYKVLSFDAESGYFRIRSLSPNPYSPQLAPCYYRNASELERIDIEKEKKRQERMDAVCDTIVDFFFSDSFQMILMSVIAIYLIWSVS